MNNETLFDKAKQNLKVAESIYSTIAINDEAYLNYVGYHIQQALELSIKYMLEMNGVNYPKTHDIDQDWQTSIMLNCILMSILMIIVRCFHCGKLEHVIF